MSTRTMRWSMNTPTGMTMGTMAMCMNQCCQAFTAIGTSMNLSPIATLMCQTHIMCIAIDGMTLQMRGVD